MRFRPCIDIHNGQVKQIVGGSLLDEDDYAKENFVATQDAGFYAGMYKNSGITGGHIIILNKNGTSFYEEDIAQAKKALQVYPGGLQIGGGIHSDNAAIFLDMGASHVIVTSYVFSGGHINYDNLNGLVDIVGKDKLVLDLSCRKKDQDYYIVTDRWQRFTDTKLTIETMKELSSYCDEFLIHAVDVEGKACGVDRKLAKLLGDFGEIPITYAGGVGSFQDLSTLKELGKDRVDVTIGSSLDIFGGHMKYQKVIDFINGGN